jgi:predicted RecA/RadA family phage recombinase
MKNTVQSGKTLSLLAPYIVASGAGFLVGSIFAVATCDAASGAAVEGVTVGVFDLAKTSAQAWTVGQKVYWDNTNKRCDTDGTVGPLIGVATAIAANPTATGYVRLNGAAPSSLEGPQTAVADIATVNASDLPTAITLANVTKAKVNELLAVLRTGGVILP